MPPSYLCAGSTVSGGPCGRGVRAVHPALTYGHGRLARVLFRRGDDFAARRRKRTHSRAWSRPSRSLHRTTSASGRHARTRAHARHAPRAAPGAAGQKGGRGAGGPCPAPSRAPLAPSSNSSQNTGLATQRTRAREWGAHPCRKKAACRPCAGQHSCLFFLCRRKVRGGRCGWSAVASGLFER